MEPDSKLRDRAPWRALLLSLAAVIVVGVVLAIVIAPAKSLLGTRRQLR